MSVPLPESIRALQPLLLFDGVCTLCNGSVDFLLRYDGDGTLRFASLQSEIGQQVSVLSGRSGTDLDTLLLVEDDQIHERSTAILRTSRHLRWPWRWGIIGLWIPRVLRDAVYRMVAKRRYRWFGQLEACRMPTPELRNRIIA